MSSASAGQLDSFLSFKATPDVEVDSLQLDKEHVLPDKSMSPKLKSESPMIDGLFDSKISLIGDKLNITHEEQTKPNPDETIQHDLTHIQQSSTSEPTVEKPVESVTKTENSETKPADKPLPIQESLQDLNKSESDDNSKVSAYARLEFENFIFYVQTLQVVLGRKSENDQSHSVDVHLGDSKAISRKHAKIFYNFGTERFELSIQGKNGAFVDDVFVERGATVPLTNKSKIQIGQIVFRFVLPGANPLEKMDSPSKPINPSDAISLRSSLYHHSPSDNIENKSGSNTPALSSKDFEPVSKVGGTSTGDAAGQKKTKEKKAPRPPKPPKKVYTLEEIPEEYRTKPACSYSNLIATCLRTHGTPKGMSLAEIYKSIKELFPYYKYCPDGWQSSVRHNLSLNKAFRKVSKEGKGWLWGLDEEFCAEKERAKKKQAAASAAKAKAAALKLEQQQLQQQKLQQQKLEQQKQLQNQAIQQPQLQQKTQAALSAQLPQGIQQSYTPQTIPLQSPTINQQQKLSQISLQNTNTSPPQRPLSNPQVQGTPSSSTSQPQQNIPTSIPIQQFQPQQPQTASSTSSSVQPQPKFTPQQSPPIQQNFPLQQQQQFVPQNPALQAQQGKPGQVQAQQNQFQSQQQYINKSTPQPGAAPFQTKTPSIQAQLAANRGISPQLSRPPSQQPTPKPVPTGLTADTKKALAHLQQQLVVLSKDLKTLVDRPTISAILTQAIAMTIAQVTQAAKTKGITSDPLATLIETNPQQLTRILTVALNAATFKVTNGRIKAPLSITPSVNNSAANSRAGTPSLPQQSPPLASPVVSKIPIQPIQQSQRSSPQPSIQTTQPQAGKAQQFAPKVNQPQPNKPVQFQNNNSQPPQPQSTFPNTQANSNPNPAANVVQPRPVKTQATPLLNTNNNGSQGPTTPNPSKVQTASSELAPNQQSTPLNSFNGQPVNQTQQLNNSFLSNIQSQSVQQPRTEPSTPMLQKVQPIVSQTVQNAEGNRPASQPNINAGLNAKLSQSFSEGLDLPQFLEDIKVNHTSSPVKVANNGSLSSTTSVPAQPVKAEEGQASSSQNSLQPAVVIQNVKPEDQASIATVEVNKANDSGQNNHNAQVKAEPVGNDSHQTGGPDLSFLHEDINDEEFDRVLKSFSKEGTPAVEDDGKVMDPEELNRLLSSDFTQTYEEDTRKRTIDDANISTDNAHNNKVAKHD